MKELSTEEKTQLRSQARTLFDTLKIGRTGLTDGIVAELRRQLVARQLVKVRIGVTDRVALNHLIKQTAEASKSHHITTTGHTAVFYLPKAS